MQNVIGTVGHLGVFTGSHAMLFYIVYVNPLFTEIMRDATILLSDYCQCSHAMAFSSVPTPT